MRRAPALALVALALVASCSDDEPDDAAVDVTTTTSEATTTSSTTNTPPSTTSTTTGPGCLSGDLPAPAEAPTPTEAELDGLDGADAAYAFLADDGWHLRVDLGDGGSTDELLATAPGDVARVLSARDLDADGTDELWLQVGTGAAATVVGLFDLDGCDLEAVLVDGVPTEFAVGGTVVLLQGLACGESDVTHLGATSEDGLTYATLDLTYELEDGQLVRVGDESGTLTADDPALVAYSDFAC